MISIYPETGGLGSWAVESVEPDNDGICHKAVFYGPDAERQARDFARYEYDRALIAQAEAQAEKTA